jgi:STE24 endopeptidase
LAAPDPLAVATQAWMERLPAAQRLAAQAATDWRMIAWLGGGLVFLAACGLIARSGMLAALRRRLESERPSAWLASLASAGLLALVLSAVNALVSGFADWRAETLLSHGGGVAAPTELGAHLARAATGVPLAIAAAMLLVPPFLWLIRRAPRTWPLIVGSVAAVLILGLGWLPYSLAAGPSLEPAAPTPASAGVMRLIADTGLPAHTMLFSPDPGFDADVTGGFGQAKVVIGPTLLAGPPAEARAYVGHLIGHYVHGDILAVTLVIAAAVFLGFLAIQRWTVPLARALGVAAESAADPEALPAMAMIGFLALTSAGLAAGAYLRWANVGADAYSLDHAREPDGLAAVIEREWDHAAVAPSPLETGVFYTHPPLRSRIVHAMAWKAANGG